VGAQGLPDFARNPSGPAADALLQVRSRLGNCTRCRLCEGRNRIVFGMGNPAADLVILGEGPGQNEDKQGLPFVGPSGEMLDKMLHGVLGLSRHEVYILNVVKCRRPSNRTPHPDEVDACRPFLDAQLAAIKPRIILALGSPAAKTLLQTTRGVMSLRGRWQTWHETQVMCTFHPAYLLRRPEDKRKTFDDLKMVRQRYDELSLLRLGAPG
jgi:uracil-DNA glycosylase